MRTAQLMMLSTFAFTLSTSTATPTLAQQKRGEALIRLSLSDDGEYYYGDRARAFVQTAEDGYVVVLQVDAAGRVRALFPLNPQDDHFVRRGHKVEVKGRGNRDAFVVDDTTGRGIVLAAFSKSAFGFSEFERNGHWDYTALADSAARTDPEAALMELLARMQPAQHFDYDVATYVVAAPRYARRGVLGPTFHPRPGWWWDGYYSPFYSPYRSSVSIWFGLTPRYRSYGYYRPVYRSRFGRWIW